MDTLLDDAMTMQFVELHTDGVSSHVPHNTGFTVVELVRHTLLDGTVTLDINQITNFVRVEVGGQRDVTMFAELTGEQVTCTTTITE